MPISFPSRHCRESRIPEVLNSNIILWGKGDWYPQPYGCLLNLFRRLIPDKSHNSIQYENCHNRCIFNSGLLILYKLIWVLFTRAFSLQKALKVNSLNGKYCNFIYNGNSTEQSFPVIIIRADKRNWNVDPNKKYTGYLNSKKKKAIRVSGLRSAVYMAFNAEMSAWAFSLHLYSSMGGLWAKRF